MADEKDPSELTNEQLDTAIEGKEEQSPPEVEAPTEPKEPETPEPEVEEVKEEAAPEETEEKPSRRESLRIQKLVSQLKQQQQPQTQQEQALDYAKALDAAPEVINQLETDRKNYGQDLYTQGVKQAESIQFHTRLEIDAPKIESKYPQLDSESPDFNPAVADAINTWYLSTAGYNHQTNTVQNANVRYADFVEGVMELANAAAGEKVAKTSKNIAKQAATTGLRPDGSSAKRLDLNKDAPQMSDEELDARIAQAIPTKK